VDAVDLESPPPEQYKFEALEAVVFTNFSANKNIFENHLRYVSNQT